MNRGVLMTIAALLLSSQAQAHVSQAQGMAHAGEHLWLLLVLVPALLLVRLSVRRFVRNSKR